MKVSFVIPLFNCLELTRACLDSLRATLPRGLAHEIILVDDGSTDGTREWLRTLAPPCRPVLLERNLGYAAATNRGAAVATGDVLGLLNNDLVLLPGWLPPLLRPLRVGWRTGLVGNVQLDATTGAVDHAGLAIDWKCKPVHRTDLPGPWSPWRYRRVPAVTGACAFVRRQTFLTLGGFDEGYRNGGEDVDFCFRAAAAGLRHWVALDSVVRHHISASPGRKDHDEINSRRLARRWRAALVAEASRIWCRLYLRQHWAEPRDLEPSLTLHCLAFLARATHRPPAPAVTVLDQRMAAEEARWDRLLGPAGE